MATSTHFSLPASLSSIVLAAGLGACATASEDRSGLGSSDGGREIGGADGGDGIKPDAPIGHPDAGPGMADAEPAEGEADAAPPDPCSTQTLNLLGNANLDSGQGGGWLETSSGDFALIINQSETDGEVNAQSGQFMAWLGGYDDAVDSLTQEVTVPADATNMRVRGHRRFITDEGGGVYDRTWVDITDGAGTQLELLKEWTNQDDNGGWAAFNFAVGGNYQGDVIRLRLRSDADGSLSTHFFYDSLLLEVDTCQ